MAIKENPTSFRIPKEIQPQISDAAFVAARDMLDIAQVETTRIMAISGLTETQAASIMAKSMIAAAWTLISNAQRQAGNSPIPERFLTVTRDIVGFKDTIKTRTKLERIGELLSTGKIEDYELASAIKAALNAEELQSYADSLMPKSTDSNEGSGGEEKLKDLFEWKGPGESPHSYSPDPMAMGDCQICGHTYEAHVQKG